jgi:hypothetical protein
MSQVTNDDAPNHGKIERNGGNGNHGAGEQGLTLRGRLHQPLITKGLRVPKPRETA